MNFSPAKTPPDRFCPIPGGRFFRRVLLVIFACSTVGLHALGQSGDTIVRDSTLITKYGLLRVNFNADGALLVTDEDYTHAQSITNSSTVRLSVGSHSMVLVHPKSADHEFRIWIGPDSLSEFSVHLDTTAPAWTLLNWSSYRRIEMGANIIVATDDDSRIYVDGDFIGVGFVKADLPGGIHVLKTANPITGQSEKKIDVNPRRITFLEMYNKPDRTTLWWLSVLPGAGQLYKNEKTKGYILLGSTFGSLVAGYVFQQRFHNDNGIYNGLLSQYNSATNEADATRLGNEAQTQHNIVRRNMWYRNGALITAGVLWALSFLDAVREPQGGYRARRDIYPFSTISFDAERSRVFLTINIAFRAN